MAAPKRCRTDGSSAIPHTGPTQTPTMHGNHELTGNDFAMDRWLRLAPYRKILDDATWCRAWQEVIASGGLAGKVVLDLHAGVGYRSLLAARAGAAAVYAVEPTWLATTCREVVAVNQCSDVVTVFQHSVGKGLSLPTPTVDVILCAWVGPAGLYDTLLDSVLWARDRFLTASGTILPNACTLSITGVALHPGTKTRGQRLDWSNVYGLDMTAMQSAIQERGDPSRELDSTEHTATTETVVVHRINAMECSLRDASFSTSFTLPWTRDGVVDRGVTRGDEPLRSDCRASSDTARGGAPRRHDTDGLVVSVAIDFDHCDAKTRYVSGQQPDAHLKNVYFSLPSSMSDRADDAVIAGSLRCIHRPTHQQSGRAGCDMALAFRNATVVTHRSDNGTSTTT
eukprot:m.117529 g.117529  ORF g.117529 m.117529 type:complete len:397 (-) comp10944_c0_seq3:1881-3071(-)